MDGVAIYYVRFKVKPNRNEERVMQTSGKEHQHQKAEIAVTEADICLLCKVA